MNLCGQFLQRSAVIVVSLFLLATPSLQADDAMDAKVRELIEQLASPNKVPPHRTGSPRHIPSWPADYDFEAQKKVYEAGDKLLALGADAIPELLRHLKDERYSVTERSGTGATHNRTVGHECRRMLGLSIKGGSASLWEGRGDPTIITNDEIEWWNENCHRPLWEIQLEFIERGLKHWRPQLPEPRGVLPNIKEYVRKLEENEAQLKETHQPILVKYPRRRMINRPGD